MIGSTWEHANRSDLTTALSNSHQLKRRTYLPRYNESRPWLAVR